MPAGIPQSYMYGTRGRMADGMPIRNRTGEQQNTVSGNPGMPIFNTPRVNGGTGTMSANPNSNALGNYIMPNMQFNSPGAQAWFQNMQAQGGYNPANIGAVPPTQQQYAATSALSQPHAAVAGSNQMQGTGYSAFMPFFRGPRPTGNGGGTIAPPVTVPNPVNS